MAQEMNAEMVIIYEDKALFVIDKPSGVVVSRTESVKGKTVQEWAEEKLKIQNSKFKIKPQRAKLKDFHDRSGIVHRLDKDTSGLLLIAKNAESFANLQEQFKKRLVKKQYLALVHGELKPEQGTVKAPIKRNPFHPQKFGVFPGGRPAETCWRVLQYGRLPPAIPPSRGKKGSDENLASGKFSFLKLNPLTGRTHQLRVHLKYLGHPIVADPFYLGRKQLGADLKFCPRLFLHAATLEFTHPQTGKVVKLESKLPRQLEQVREKLLYPKYSGLPL